jgi:hypothetical protein
MHQKGAVRDVGDPHPGGALDAIDDVVGMAAIPGLDRDVAEHALSAHLDQVHGADVPAGLADDRGDAAQHAGLVPDLEPNREAVGGAGGYGHQSLVMAGI